MYSITLRSFREALAYQGFSELKNMCSFRSSPLTTKSCVLVVASMLTACGGSGGGQEVVTQIDDMNAAVGTLLATYRADDLTPLEQLPPSGTSTYRGYLSTQYGPTSGANAPRLVGAMEIQVSFDSPPEMVTGSAYDFIDEESARLDGTLTLSGGTLTAVDQSLDATFRFEGEGNLTDASGNTLDVQLAFSGDFLGEEAAAIGGDVDGSVVLNGAAPEDLAGFFISEQDTP
ncbi:hypothetical protein [Yoonia algicola]|uniref:Transferrin-binding protein B C-lobe/N-lobe beta barrel domain-containing protein n=1 Tax=Yoonia algicola TaxID=3137368 RepID=A0AAN0NIL3_9RHOB